MDRKFETSSSLQLNVTNILIIAVKLTICICIYVSQQEFVSRKDD